MQWKEAKTHELYVIAFDDPYAEPMDVYEAKNEINRRKQAAAERKRNRVQHIEKKHYPK